MQSKENQSVHFNCSLTFLSVLIQILTSHMEATGEAADRKEDFWTPYTLVSFSISSWVLSFCQALFQEVHMDTMSYCMMPKQQVSCRAHPLCSRLPEQALLLLSFHKCRVSPAPWTHTSIKTSCQNKMNVSEWCGQHGAEKRSWSYCPISGLSPGTSIVDMNSISDIGLTTSRLCLPTIWSDPVWINLCSLKQ